MWAPRTTSLRALLLPLFVAVILAFPHPTHAQLLPACDPIPGQDVSLRQDVTEDCTVSHLLQLVVNIYNFLIGLAALVAILFLIYGAARMLYWGFLENSEQELAEAKLTVRRSIGGFVIVLLAYVLVNTTIGFLGGQGINEILNSVLSPSTTSFTGGAGRLDDSDGLLPTSDPAPLESAAQVADSNNDGVVSPDEAVTALLGAWSSQELVQSETGYHQSFDIDSNGLVDTDDVAAFEIVYQTNGNEVTWNLFSIAWAAATDAALTLLDHNRDSGVELEEGRPVFIAALESAQATTTPEVINSSLDLNTDGVVDTTDLVDIADTYLGKRIDANQTSGSTTTTDHRGKQWARDYVSVSENESPFAKGWSPSRLGTVAIFNQGVNTLQRCQGTDQLGSQSGLATVSLTPTDESVPRQGEVSSLMRTSKFNFAIPLDATITGVQAEVRRRGSHARDEVLRLVKNGELTGANKARETNWSSMFATATYGGISDLWGTTWTAADINNPNFGVGIAVERSVDPDESLGSNQPGAGLDCVGVQVTWEGGTYNVCGNGVTETYGDTVEACDNGPSDTTGTCTPQCLWNTAITGGISCLEVRHVSLPPPPWPHNPADIEYDEVVGRIPSFNRDTHGLIYRQDEFAAIEATGGTVINVADDGTFSHRATTGQLELLHIDFGSIARVNIQNPGDAAACQTPIAELPEPDPDVYYVRTCARTHSNLQTIADVGCAQLEDNFSGGQGRIWISSGASLPHSGAQQACNTIPVGGKVWRVPTRAEIESLGPTHNGGANQFDGLGFYIGATDASVWTNENLSPGYAWAASMHTGQGGPALASYRLPVFCVTDL